MRKISKKQSVKQANYVKICKEIDEEMLDADDRIYCVSCSRSLAIRSRSLTSWGHSHLLPKGRFPQYAACKWNIAPRCQDFGGYKGCHNALDSNDFTRIARFHDLEVIMELLQKYDIGTYHKFQTKLQEYADSLR